jgi:hypothetical protein
MGEVTVTINHKPYRLENFSYGLGRTEDCKPGEVDCISLSFNIYGKNDLDSFMLKEPFSCEISIYDESGGVFRSIKCENAEITSYSRRRGRSGLLHGKRTGGREGDALKRRY